MGGKAAGILALGIAECLLILPLAGAQDHHLHVQAHDVVEGVGDQGEALVAHQAGDAADEGDVGVLLKAHGPLEGGLAGGLAGDVLGGVVLGQVGAGGGVVEVHVDAVYDTAELAVLLADDPIHAPGIEGGVQLLGVSGGDGGHLAGGQDGPLHQVHVPEVGQHALVEVAAVQADDVLEDLLAVAALVFDVVDGEDGVGVRQLGHPVALLQQVDGDQGGLPVVAVDDVRRPVQLGGGGQNGTGEEGEALAVVEVAVDLGALEVVFVVHEPVGDALPLQLEQAAVGLPPGQGDVEVLEEGHLVPPELADALVEGEDDGDLVALLGQGLGQGTGHVGQTAGLDERSAFAGYIHDFHKCRASPQAEVWEPAGFLSSLAVRQGSRIPPDALLISLLYSFPVSCNIGIFHEHFSCRSRFFRPSPVHFTENAQIVEFFAMVMG